MKNKIRLVILFGAIALCIAANVVLTLQISPVVATYPDTNTVYVAGGSLANINGQYGLFSRDGVVDTWTNNLVDGTGKPIQAVLHDFGGNTFGDSPWLITNVSGTIIYHANEYNQGNNHLGIGPGDPPWTDAGGGGSVPTVLFATNSRSIRIVTSGDSTVAFPMPAYDTNWIYLATNGDDIFAAYGRADRPCKSFTYCLTNFARAGVTVFCGPGFYDIPDWPNWTRIPTNMNFIGSGRGVTFLNFKYHSPSSDRALYLNNSNYFANFSCSNVWFYGGVLAATNVILENVDASALGDVVVAQVGSAGMTLINCRLDGNSDKIADLSSGASYEWMSNYFLTAINCVFTGGGGSDGDGLNIMAGKLRKNFINCTGINGRPINTCTNFNFTLQTIKRPALVRTNFIDGQLYTNVYPVDVEVSQSFSNAVPVAGKIQRQLWVFAQGAATVTGTTNRAGDLYSQTPITNHVFLFASVPPQYVFCFTNPLLTTADSKVSPGSGQLQIP